MGITEYPAQSRVDGTLLLDPSADEAYREDASVLLAMMPSTDLVRPTAQPGMRATRVVMLGLLCILGA